MNYRQTPRFQRLQSRLMALDPGERAIIASAFPELREQEAGREAGMELWAKGMKGQEDARAVSLANRSRTMEIRRGLGEAELALDRDQEGVMQTLGLANLGASGTFGYLQGQQDRERAKRVRALAALYGPGEV